MKSMGTTLVSELERLASSLEADETSLKDESLEALAEKMAKELRVKPDEVAILGVSQRWRHLHFLVPPALKNEQIGSCSAHSKGKPARN
jgi:hypothetical protein